MKQLYKFAAVAIAAMLLVNCTKEDLEPTYIPVQEGDMIQFGGRAGFAANDADSRTIYGEDYTYNGVKYQSIDWILNKDMVEICSPQATIVGGSADMPYVPYLVTGVSGGQTSTTDHTRDYATLTPKGSGSGLQWGSAAVHTFYAMYPTAFDFDATVDGELVTVDQGVKLDVAGENVTMHGTVPVAQNPLSITKEGNVYVAAPQMRYAYMAAKTVHNTTTDGNKVPLSFVPVVTAVEIELAFPDDGVVDQTYNDIYVGQIMLTSKDNKLSGAFTADLTAWDPTSTASPDCALNEVEASYNYVSISTLLQTADSQIPLPIKLNEGESIKFTAFLLPHTDISDLTVSYQMMAETPKSKSLAGAGAILAKLKTRITKVKLPVVAVTPDEPDPGLTAANWMKELMERKPHVTMSGLSLPGTGGSFTYNNSNLSAYNREQYVASDAGRTKAMDFDKQWNLGIRAFEITSNRPNYDENTANDEVDGVYTYNLATQNITCNKQSVNMTVGNALNMIIKKVESHPNETAVVILVYQPHDRDCARNAYYYALALRNMYDQYNKTAADGESIFKVYTPGMELSDAAGHVLLMARINQRDEGEVAGDTGTSTSATNATTNWTKAVDAIGKRNIVLIDGCGTAKDRWGARGYKVTSSGTDNETVAFPDISNEFSYPLVIEDYMERNGNYLYASTGAMNADYEITYPYGDVSVTWTQGFLFWEETRDGIVSRPNPATKPTDGNFSLGFGYNTYNGAGVTAFKCWYQDWSRVVAEAAYSNDIYWFESYYEKLNHVLMTYDMAVDQVNTNQIYVNSLCGYLADGTSDSLKPSTGSLNYGGSGGNIQGLAKKIVPEFYNYVLKRSSDNTTGPTGVVMLDYVSDKPEDGGAHFLPGLIIANNLKSN